MSSTNELIQTLRHDINGTCKLLQSALPLFEDLLQNDPEEAKILLKEMSESANRLSTKLLEKMKEEVL